MEPCFESENFVVRLPSLPLVDRKDGGHLLIFPKVKVVNRQALSVRQAIELMRLTIVAGEAMTRVLIKHGVDIGRINYHDDGNWSVFKPGGPCLHVHLYGRAKSAKVQKYGQALYFPHKEENPEFYKNCKSLTKRDVSAITSEIKKLLKQEKYSDEEWNLT